MLLIFSFMFCFLSCLFSISVLVSSFSFATYSPTSRPLAGFMFCLSCRDSSLSSDCCHTPFCPSIFTRYRRLETLSEVPVFCGISEGAQTLEFKSMNSFVYPDLKKHLHQLDSILELGPICMLDNLCIGNKRT